MKKCVRVRCPFWICWTIPFNFKIGPVLTKLRTLRNVLSTSGTLNWSGKTFCVTRDQGILSCICFICFLISTAAADFSNIDCCCRNNLVFPFDHRQLCTDEISYQVFLLLMCLDKHILSIDILSILPNMNLFLKVFPIFLVKLFFVQTLVSY